MDEAGGCCGLLVIVVLIVLGVVVWRGMRSEPEAALIPVAEREEAIEQAPRVDAKASPEQKRQWNPIHGWPFAARAVLIGLGVLYGLGLFLIRPAAQRAKRHGASNQHAALTALALFAMSPVVVPVKGVWYGLGALGEALTRTPDGNGKPTRPRGLDDLE
ncbi:hypothetical protein [Tautonia rosea]|uniref:hypothetical protein n=1 Tax=Tautonia rosea TaxID=2728037 RepID=UPI0014732849|nr:hypothetical protein [Tautonia rosea]